LNIFLFNVPYGEPTCRLRCAHHTPTWEIRGLIVSTPLEVCRLVIRLLAISTLIFRHLVLRILGMNTRTIGILMISIPIVQTSSRFPLRLCGMARTVGITPRLLVEHSRRLQARVPPRLIDITDQPPLHSRRCAKPPGRDLRCLRRPLDRHGQGTLLQEERAMSFTWSPRVAMSRDEMDRVLQQKLVARLTSIRPDGDPHTTPLW
jgi:hypothetical protein